MTTINIQGKRVKVDDSFMSLSPEQQNATVDEIAQSLGNQAPEQPEARWDHKVGAAIDGVAQGLTFGYSDEIAAGMASGGGLWGDYDEELASERGRMAENKELAGGYELGGQVVGGLAGGLGLAKGGLTMLSKAPTVGKAALEGAAYGAAHGSGAAVEGNRLEGAAIGGVLGAATGGIAQKAGNAIKGKFAHKAVSNPASSLDELTLKTSEIYKQAEAAGIRINKAATKHLSKNLKYAAGSLNKKLRANTFGVVKDLDDALGKEISLTQLDELRQTISLSMKRAQPQDVLKLQRMKKIIDAFEDNIQPKDITGDIRGFDLIKQARQLNVRKQKTKQIENLIELASVKGEGQYSQAGAVRAISQKSEALYKRIVDGKEKGFSKEEVELIRQMATGKTSSAIMRALSKLAPRGIVSFGVGQGVGSMIPGGNLLLPGAGHFAANSVDKSMIKAANTLRDNVSRGSSLAPSRAVSSTPRHLIPPLSQQSANQTSQATNSNRKNPPNQQRTYR